MRMFPIIMNKVPRSSKTRENFLSHVLYKNSKRTIALAIQELAESFNLIHHKKLELEAFDSTRMTLELANHFVVVNFEPDPRVPIILGRPFLRTAKALIDLYEEKLTLRVGKEELVYYADKSENKEQGKTFFADELLLLISYTTGRMMIQALFFHTTPLSDKDECFAPEDDNDEIDDFLAIKVSSNLEEGYFDSEGDIAFLDNLLSDDDSHNLGSKVSLPMSPILVEDSEPTAMKRLIFSLFQII
ncbi:reverse transcriptase domain-containing protein [Tanacetum coccineum]